MQCVCVSRGRWFQSSSWIQAAEEFQIKDLKLLNTQLVSWKVSRKDAVWCCSEVSRFPGCFSRSLLEEEDSSSSSRRCECECVCCSVYPIFALHIFTACVLYCTKEDALNTGFLSRGSAPLRNNNNKHGLINWWALLHIQFQFIQSVLCN